VSAAGAYSDSTAAADFAPYKFLKDIQNASLQKIGGSTYLALRMQKGRYGTGTGKCGVYARMPLNNVKLVRVATLEYTCALPVYDPRSTWH
jgi:hypothetical protein